MQCSNMSEERVVFSELNGSYLKEPKGKSHSAPNREGFPWHVITAFQIVLICLLLLAVAALRCIDFQASHKCQNNDIQDHGKSSIHIKHESFSNAQCKSEKPREAFINKWSCCRKKCYYFSHIFKNFEESRQFCIDMGSHLLKIEDKDEQEFIQSLAFYFHWIGLSRQESSSQWMWEDGTLMQSNLTLQCSNIAINNCVYTTTGKLAANVCNKLYYSICEKNSPDDDLGEDK